MHFYNQSELFQVLLSAAEGPGLAPNPLLLQGYKEKRLRHAIQSLKTRNLFLYTEGARQSTDLNAVTTIYTQPAGVRLMVIGYAENFRYGAISSRTHGGPVDLVWPQEHRVRIVGRNQRAIVEDFVPSQAGVSGEPRYTSAIFTVPEILEANEQFAIDLGYDTAAIAPTEVEAQAFVFFCLKVKDKLTQEDEETIRDVQYAIANNDFQRGEYLNAVSLGLGSVHFSTALAGGTAVCNTRPATSPLLITGFGTNLNASKIKITDIADGYSFSLDKYMQSSALNMPDFQNQTGAIDLGTPVSAPIFTQYQLFAMPHLLKRGSQLRVDVVNGGDSGSGVNTVVDTQDGNFIVFQAITV